MKIKVSFLDDSMSEFERSAFAHGVAAFVAKEKFDLYKFQSLARTTDSQNRRLLDTFAGYDGVKFSALSPAEKETFVENMSALFGLKIELIKQGLLRRALNRTSKYLFQEFGLFPVGMIAVLLIVGSVALVKLDSVLSVAKAAPTPLFPIAINSEPLKQNQPPLTVTNFHQPLKQIQQYQSDSNAFCGFNAADALICSTIITEQPQQWLRGLAPLVGAATASKEPKGRYSVQIKVEPIPATPDDTGDSS